MMTASHYHVPETIRSEELRGKQLGLIRLTIDDLLNWERAEELASSTNRQNLNTNLSTSRFETRIGNDPGWYGVRSLEELREKMEKGSKEHASRVSDMYATLRGSLPTKMLQLPDRRRRARWREEGDELDREAVYRGELDRAWRRMEREPGSVPVVTVVFQWGANSNRAADDLFWSGALATLLTDHLIATGHDVELLGLDYIEHDRGVHTCTLIDMKTAQEPLRVGTLATATAVPAVYRTQVFRLRQAHKAKTRRNGSVGGTVRATEKQVHEALGHFGIDAREIVFLPLVYSLEAAIAAAKEALADIGRR